MKYKLLILIILIFLTSCQNSIQENKESAKEEPIVAEQPDSQKMPEQNIKNSKEQRQLDCAEYWKNISRKRSLKATYINDILSNYKLSENNVKFLNALKNEEQNDYAFNKVLSSIFRLSNTRIGLVTSPKYKHINDQLIPISKEMELIEKFSAIKENIREHPDTIRFYPMLLNAAFNKKPKPTINYYTINKIGSTQILDLGVYAGECLDYYEYSIDTTNILITDKLLFSSPYIIDLVFENNPQIDLLLQNDYKEECMDCPNSSEFQKTFAKIKGTDNLYFVYADTFPINDKLDTPFRALVFINKINEIIYLWYDEIDLFGCGCL